MNSYFIRTSFEKLELLHENVLETLKHTIKNYEAVKNKHKVEEEYNEFVEKFFSNELSNEQIEEYLNKEYQGKKIRQYIDVVYSGERGIKVTKNDSIFSFTRGLDELDRWDYKFETAIKTPIVNVVTLYEGFIRSLIKADCTEGHYDLINNENINLDKLKQLNFDENKILSYLVDSYCDNKLRGENKRIRQVISTIGIDCKDCENIIEDFEEIYFRRNMYVHNIDNITIDYLSLPARVKDKWIKDKSLLNTPEYFSHVFQTVKKIMLMIIIKKCLFKEKNEKDLETLETLVYTLYYQNKNYNVASFAYKQMEKLTWITQINRYFYFVNYMVCLKQLKSDLFYKELEKWDTTTAATIFKVAKKLIADDYKDINNLIFSILITDEQYLAMGEEERALYFVKSCINDWPLFSEYRETEYYKELIDKFN